MEMSLNVSNRLVTTHLADVNVPTAETGITKDNQIAERQSLVFKTNKDIEIKAKMVAPRMRNVKTVVSHIKTIFESAWMSKPGNFFV